MARKSRRLLVMNGRYKGSEVSVMVKLSKKMLEKHCPFIVRIVDCFRTENSIYMILEYCGEGDLEKFLNDKGKLSEAEAMHIIYEVRLSIM
jgi:serine/threonine protein kinase